MNGASVVAIVVAAGRSRRMASTLSGSINKMMLSARGRTVLAWTLSIFERHPAVARIYVTASEDDVERYTDLIDAEGFTKVAGVIVGGAERQQSVHLALRYVAQHDPEADPLVAVHDGARPLLRTARLDEVLDAARPGAAAGGGALLCVPAKETLKRARHGVVVETVPREEMMVAQTPQVFGLRALLAAHAAAEREGFAATDDASLIERAGGVVRVVVGDYDNIKITTPEDVVVLEGLLDQREVPTHG